MQAKLYKILVLIIFSALLNTFLISCKENNIRIKKITGKQVEINPNFKSDSSFIKTIEPYRIILQSEINTVLCYNPRTLNRNDGELESSLGNIFADICFQKADSIFKQKTGNKIDFALFNYAGMRNPIPKGEVTVKDIFGLMPFENMLVVVQLSGKQIQALINYLEAGKVAHPISNLRLKMQGDRIISVSINKQDFDPGKNYYVLTHDYLQHGGNNMVFFKEPISLFNTEYKVRDAIIDHLKSLDTLHAKLDGRFIKIE